MSNVLVNDSTAIGFDGNQKIKAVQS